MDDFNLEGLFGGKAAFEPSSGFRGLAIANWDLYQAHLQVGFTSEQSMEIVKTFVTNAMIYGFTQNEGGDRDA